MATTPNIRIDHAPTMLIGTEETALQKIDPLKTLFRRLFEFLPGHARGHVVAGLGEFIGTTVFIFMAFAAAQVAFISSNDTRKGNIDTEVTSVTPQELLYISLGAAFSLVVTAWTFFRISGGLFNPVVSIGMGLIGALTWARVTILCVVQTVGTIVAAYMVSALFPGGLNTGTALHPHVGLAQGTIIEMLLTAQLVFTIFMLAAEKHAATFIAPVGIGLSLFIAEMIGVLFTGGSLNPVRSLAPAIVTRTFPSYHWIYWVGPMAGSCLAVLLYKLIKALEYETAQDDDGDMKPILPTSARNNLDGTPHSAVLAFNVQSDPTTSPASQDAQHLQVPTYDKTPFAHDKEFENARKHSALYPVHSSERSIDVNMFKVPPVLRTDIEYLAARYSEKLQASTNPQASNPSRNTDSLLPKMGPLVRTKSGYSVGQYSTTLEDDDMDFKCKGIAVNSAQSEIQPITRTNTEYSSVYYSAHSRISIDSVVKRQTRTRVPTDEIWEQPKKKVSWLV